jgi:putative membrane protein
VLTRWAGESAVSLTPGGQIGGPVLMARHLAQGGLPMAQAAAVITVSTTLQTLAQILFAVLGVALLGARLLQPAVRSALLIAGAVLALTTVPFYFVQRRGLFGRVTRWASRFAGRRDWSELMSQAEAIDSAVDETYRCRRRATWSFLLSLIGWLVGTGEVYLILVLLNAPVSWRDALLLESLGQAIRGAGFAIPGSLGVQEGGYLLLAPLAGLTPNIALALSLAKRSRELLLGLPGLLYLHLSEREFRRRRSGRVAADTYK